ncbi:MAG: Ig-like domain-containing protein [Terracidiphilus sp.]
MVTIPGVVSVTPAQGATGVALNTTVTATFNMAMNPATITASSFLLASPAGPVTGTVSYASMVATFTPAAALSPGVTYTATITTAAASPGGAELVNNYVWSFTTLAAVIPPVPIVVSVTPLPFAQNVPVKAPITATFSQSMTSSVASAFTVEAPGGVVVAGTVTLNESGTVATFTPTAGALANGTTYTATITTAAKDQAGTPLAANYVWSFTTIAAVIPPVPIVVSVTPLPFAQNVLTNAPITATFSLAMTSSVASAFTVEGPGGVPVAGTVTLNGNGTVATFTPSAGPLANGTTYTATITTAAKDQAGTPLAGNYVWTFTTISSTTPIVVSVTPVQGAANVAVNATISATFNQAMDAASIGPMTFTVAAPGGVAVPGTVGLSANGLVATFTPTSGVLAFDTTYTATITTGAMSKAGIPLVADYRWSFTTITPAPVVVMTVPANSATGVPIAQVLHATFNEAMNCASLASPANSFTMTGPGMKSIAGTVGCSGSMATFTPNADLAVNTLYTATISTAAQDLAGTPMAANYVWTFRTVPAAPLAPTVISTVPVNLAVDVPINQVLSATFSEAMDPESINSATFLLKATKSGDAVNGVIAYVPAGSVATFAPFAKLLPSTEYTATITSGALDLNDDAGVVPYTWTFTTAAAAAAIPPTVISTIPVTTPEDTNVPLNQVVSATFSEAMNPATISSSNFKLMAQGSSTPVSGLVAYAAISKQLVFVPAANLDADTTYTATITTGVQDLAGDPMANNYVWTFKTAAAVVVTPPDLVSTIPANLATKVALNVAVSATFSEAMDPLTLTPETFQLTTGGTLNAGGTLIPAAITYDPINFIATLTPAAPLMASTTYTVLVTKGATDLAGNPLSNMGAPNPWTFTTGAAVVTPPVILGPTISLFGGFGGSAGMTNQGIYTIINGYIGTTGVSTIITGFHDTTVVVGGVNECTYTETTLDIGVVNGTINTAAPPPTVGCPNEGTAATFAVATEAQAEALTAYNTLAAIPNGLDVSVCPGCGGGNAGELGNRTLAPGIYKSAPGSYGITAGDLTLDAKGDPTASWVFQMATTLTVGTPSAHRNVKLVNGAKASNVYWQVGTAATVNGILGGGTMAGTIISQAGVSISTAGVAEVTTINGRALALVGPVTMVNTVINVPTP